MAPRKSPLNVKQIRDAVTPKGPVPAPVPIVDDEAASASKSVSDYEAKRLKKMNRG